MLVIDFKPPNSKISIGRFLNGISQKKERPKKGRSI